MRGLTIFAILGFCSVALSAAGQDVLSTKSNGALFQQQLDVLDGRAAQQYANSVRLKPPALNIPGVPLEDDTRSYTPSAYLDNARAVARRHAIPETLFLRLVTQESGWNPRAVSPKGAIGLAQLMPATARALGVDPRDPEQNLEGGARYLRQQFDAFGSWRLALAAYNAGPGAVQKHNGIPPFKETQNYVIAILGR
ncbi:MAG: lytic transglycosylase domain-containing protein [Pseudomonadota bacterium]